MNNYHLDQALIITKQLILPCGCYAYRIDGVKSGLHGRDCKIPFKDLIPDGKVVSIHEFANSKWYLNNPWPL